MDFDDTLCGGTMLKCGTDELRKRSAWGDK